MSRTPDVPPEDATGDPDPQAVCLIFEPGCDWSLSKEYTGHRDMAHSMT